MVKKRKTKKKGTKKTTKKRGGKKAFGGYTVNFKDCEHSLEQIFGTKPIPPSQMTKKLWAYVKRNRLNKR
jgi:chromatin remodeling complex protein RSC6